MTIRKMFKSIAFLLAASPLLASPPPPVNETLPPPRTNNSWTTFALGAVKRIAFDQTGCMWLATFGGGMIRWQPGSDSFTRFTTKDGLKTNNLWALAVSPDNRIWTAGGPFNYPGVSYFDGTTWTTLTNRDGLVYNYVNALAAGSDNSLWFGTDRGVSRLQENVWTTFTQADGLAGDGVASIHCSSNSSIWFGHYSHGVSHFNGQAWTIYTKEDGLPSNAIAVFGAAPDSAVWFGAIDDGGVARFRDGIWQRYTQADGMVGTYCESFAAEKNGVLWFGSCGCGVTRFDGTMWTPIRTADGLPSPYVFAVALSPDGSVWVGSDGGISTFTGGSSSVDVDKQAPGDFRLLPNYPNPFNPETTIRYSILQNGPVEIAIYNAAGDKIRTLVDAVEASGEHAIRWDGTNESGQPVAAGVYICRMRRATLIFSRKMLLLK